MTPKELAVPLWAHRLVVRSALDRAQAQRAAVEEVLALTLENGKRFFGIQ